jgi:hypothetical protein
MIAKDGPVVSLTSHGARIASVYLVLEAIARGSIRPSRMILWLDDKSALSDLPRSLKRMQKRGLEVGLSDDNYGPHTKYYPYLKSLKTFDVPLVTADDDVMYPRYWLKHLVLAHREHPEVVNCHRAHVVSVKEGAISAYREWGSCRSTEASFANFATGVSGVIYPPRLLAALSLAGSGFRECCPKADDLWLHVQAIRAGYRIRQITSRSRHFLVLPDSQKTALFDFNVLRASPGNDEQAQKTYIESDIKVIVKAGVKGEHLGGGNEDY